MDKKTIIGFILIALFGFGFMYFSNPAGLNNPPAPPPIANDTATPLPEEASPLSPTAPVAALNENIPHQIIRAETDLFEIEFSTLGATINSLRLKNYLDNGQPLEMVLRGHQENDGAFLIFFRPDNLGVPFYGNFVFTDRGNGIYEFSSHGYVRQNNDDVPFILTKTYEFKPGEYLFRLEVAFTQPDGQFLPLNFNGASYTLQAVPQIGPTFTQIDNRNVFRHNVYLNDGRRRQINLRNGFASVDERVGWAGINEKYFAFIGVPDHSSYRQIWTDIPVSGLEQGNQFSFVRSTIRSSAQADTFYFYVGPRLEQYLNRYNNANNNAFGVSGFDLGRVMDQSAFLWPLERFLTWLLRLFYGLVGNWGFSILLVTLLIRIALFPLSLKGMLSAARMSELQPKLKEIQERFKGQPQELQKATMQLYQKEGVNPMAGCFPLLLQMPILFAMFGIFNRYFDFRHAPFLGWITDLSAPDQIATLPFTIPIFIGSAIRLLPVFYVLTQLLMNKIMQASQPMQNPSMKMMMNLMPIIFFFVLYDMPSGLLLYWTFSNILALVQQLIINWLKKSGRIKPPKPKKGFMARLMEQANANAKAQNKIAPTRKKR
ncbi:MAG: membrane protein insertase YidC [Spirochaetaceae bacterium]|nr:membrane protein insertase YidC [Spirochaetaceae bacterium]